MKLRDKLLREIDRLKNLGLIDSNTANTLREKIELNMIEFIVPRKILCSFSAGKDYRLNLFWCPRCGALFSHLPRNMRCSKCDTLVNQAYVFAGQFSFKPPTSVSPERVLRPITADINSFCGRKRRLKSIVCTDLERPIESLAWACPVEDLSCPYARREGRYVLCVEDRYAKGKKGGARKSGPVRVRLWVRGLLPINNLRIHYIPTLPSEGMTKPISVALHYYNPASAEEIAFSKELLPGIEKIFFVSELSVVQFSLCYTVGPPTAPLRKKAVSLNYSENNIQILSRRMTTEGIVLKIKQEVIKKVGEESREQKNALFHTVSHAFLRPLPLFTGLDPNEFFESISPEDNEIAVFDNSPGGLGGIASMIDEGELSLDYQGKISKSWFCELGCYSACRACLFVENCGWINRSLKRQMLRYVVGGG